MSANYFSNNVHNKKNGKYNIHIFCFVFFCFSAANSHSHSHSNYNNIHKISQARNINAFCPTTMMNDEEKNPRAFTLSEGRNINACCLTTIVDDDDDDDDDDE